jgi:hypothetical protein
LPSGNDPKFKPKDGINRDIVDFCRGTEALIHGAQYTDEEIKDKQGWGHSSYSQAIQVAPKRHTKTGWSWPTMIRTVTIHFCPTWNTGIKSASVTSCSLVKGWLSIGGRS